MDKAVGPIHFQGMPRERDSSPAKTIHQIVEEHQHAYPVEAYDFVQQGLLYTVTQMHGAPRPGMNRHITGQELSLGLRDFAQNQWGMMARLVLQRWNISRTIDFGKIVYHLVDGGILKTTPDDRVEDFLDVFDFRHEFEARYRVEVPAVLGEPASSTPRSGAA